MKLSWFGAVSIHEIHMHSNTWMRNKKFHPHVCHPWGLMCYHMCSGAAERTLEEKARRVHKACLHTVPGALPCSLGWAEVPPSDSRQPQHKPGICWLRDSSYACFTCKETLIFFSLLFCDLTTVPKVTGEKFNVDFNTKKLTQVHVPLIEEKIT